MKNLLLSFAMTMLLASCSCFHVHKASVTQGNVITSEDIRQLHVGLSEAEVVDRMGTPLLVNLTTPHRIDYIYTYQASTLPRVTRQVTCLFKQGRLVKIEKSL